MELPPWVWEIVPFIAMVTVECTDVGYSTISKAALAEGMNKIVAVVYSNALGTVILLPYFIFCRKKRAPVTSNLLWKFFILGLIGSTGQALSLTGLSLSSPTVLSAMANLIPIFTFLLAVIFRMEALDLRRSSSQAKSLGAVVAVTGAFVVTLYHGPAIWTHTLTSNHGNQILLSKQSDWILGGFLLAFVCFLSAVWNVFQGATVKAYPEEMTIVFFFTFFITVQSAVFALILESSASAWKMNTRSEILAVVYTAILGSLFRITVHTWCLRMKGPVYVAMFKPLGIVIAAILTVTFLGETLYLGSVIGYVIIALGFYSVMWGQIKEKSQGPGNEDCRGESSSQGKPLLHKEET